MPHNPMSIDEYRAACRRLGLSPSYSAGAVLGVSQVTAARYASGSRKIPMPIALLLRLMLAAGAVYDIEPEDWYKRTTEAIVTLEALRDLLP